MSDKSQHLADLAAIRPPIGISDEGEFVSIRETVRRHIQSEFSQGNLIPGTAATRGNMHRERMQLLRSNIDAAEKIEAQWSAVLRRCVAAPTREPSCIVRQDDIILAPIVSCGYDASQRG